MINGKLSFFHVNQLSLTLDHFCFTLGNFISTPENLGPRVNLTSNFSFSYNVFHSYISLVCQNVALCGNGLNIVNAVSVNARTANINLNRYIVSVRIANLAVPARLRLNLPYLNRLSDSRSVTI